MAGTSSFERASALPGLLVPARLDPLCAAAQHGAAHPAARGRQSRSGPCGRRLLTSSAFRLGESWRESEATAGDLLV